MVQRAARPGPQTLADLRTRVDAAREELVVARRLDGVERGQLAASQRRLLCALESFIRALDAAGLSPHRQLRVEVDLLRGVTGGGGGPYHRGV